MRSFHKKSLFGKEAHVIYFGILLECANGNRLVDFYSAMAAQLRQCLILVYALVHVPDGVVSVSSDSENTFNNRWVKFGSAFSIINAGMSTTGYVFDTRTGWD